MGEVGGDREFARAAAKSVRRRFNFVVVGAPSSHLPVRANRQHHALSNAYATLQHKVHSLPVPEPAD